MATARLWDPAQLPDLLPRLCHKIIAPHVIQSLLERRKAAEHVYAVILSRIDDPRARSLDRHSVRLDGMIRDVG